MYCFGNNLYSARLWFRSEGRAMKAPPYLIILIKETFFTLLQNKNYFLATWLKRINKKVDLMNMNRSVTLNFIFLAVYLSIS